MQVILDSASVSSAPDGQEPGGRLPPADHLHRRLPPDCMNLVALERASVRPCAPGWRLDVDNRHCPISSLTKPFERYCACHKCPLLLIDLREARELRCRSTTHCSLSTHLFLFLFCVKTRRFKELSQSTNINPILLIFRCCHIIGLIAIIQVVTQGLSHFRMIRLGNCSREGLRYHGTHGSNLGFLAGTRGAKAHALSLVVCVYH